MFFKKIANFFKNIYQGIKKRLTTEKETKQSDKTEKETEQSSEDIEQRTDSEVKTVDIEGTRAVDLRSIIKMESNKNKIFINVVNKNYYVQKDEFLQFYNYYYNQIVNQIKLSGMVEEEFQGYENLAPVLNVEEFSDSNYTEISL